MPYRMIPFALALFLSPMAFADITGQPRVIDGDTLEIAGQRIRLHGIDAPEIRFTNYACWSFRLSMFGHPAHQPPLFSKARCGCSLS